MPEPGRAEDPGVPTPTSPPGPDPTVVTTQIIDKEIRHLREFLESVMDERDDRYGNRFDAQEKATATAFQASEKAVSAAFKSAQEAVNKAEVSIEKRADATYVTLTDLQRQLTALMPRSEAEQRVAANAEKIDRLEKLLQVMVTREEYDARHKALQDAVASIGSRVDKYEGYVGGAQVDRRLQDIKEQIDSNTTSILVGAGQKQGSTESRAAMYALVGLGAAMLGGIAAVLALWPGP